MQSYSVEINIYRNWFPSTHDWVLWKTLKIAINSNISWILTQHEKETIIYSFIDQFPVIETSCISKYSQKILDQLIFREEFSKNLVLPVRFLAKHVITEFTSGSMIYQKIPDIC